MRRRTATLFALVIAALALVAAGCGGDDSGTTTTEASATVEWANSLCSAITSWTDDMTTIGNELKDPSSLNSDGLKQAGDDAVAATQDLADQVKALGAPETEAGQQAKSALDAMATTLEQESATIKDAVEGASGLTGLLSAAPTIVTSINAMSTAVNSTYEQLQSLDAKGELTDAFEQAESCSSLSSSS